MGFRIGEETKERAAAMSSFHEVAGSDPSALLVVDEDT
jgi:hypothetical protein